MKIKTVHIKNVRGLGNHKVKPNMILNKPSVLGSVVDKKKIALR